ncbi:MAG: Rne/Rng family ribonuclease [Marinilabiliaceae bacterium]|nr:Rne/Rng family ribonuclease [Marinilabiliaceae bacterium]
MSAELYVDAAPNELTIALLEEKRLVELRKEKSNVQFAVGDIFLGKIRKLMPGLNAAFVDIGYGKDAFLHYLDLGPQIKAILKYLDHVQTKKGTPPLNKLKHDGDIDKKGTIDQILSVGKDIFVQIAKEPISTKGPRLTSEISLAGRNLIIVPFSDKISVSQKINLHEERSRLRRLIVSIKPKNYGVIVRTVAEGKKVAELDKELKTLVKRWEDSISGIKEMKAPYLIVSEVGRTSAFLRDLFNPDFQAIHVNNKVVYREMKDYIELISPGHEKIVKLHQGAVPLFEKFGIVRQMKTGFGKTVSLKSGSYLIIEHTEALHVIDVNSGTRSRSATNQEANALQVNLVAIEEIVRQLRLRDMGGIIVVDFIDMQEPEHRLQIYEKMKEKMELDRTKHNILPLSKFGLMQITRQRIRPVMNIETNEICPSCNGKGKIVSSINIVEEIQTSLRLAAEQMKKEKSTLWVHPYLYAYLKQGIFSISLKWKWMFRFKLKIKHTETLAFLEYKITDAQNQKIEVKL